MKLAIVGATGMVGRTMLEVLKERKINIEKLYLVASEANKGKVIKIQWRRIRINYLRRCFNFRCRLCPFFCWW